MKPYLVIVCGVLYPKPSPTGLCALRYAALLQDVYDISFIALPSDGCGGHFIYDGFDVNILTSRRLFQEKNTKGLIRRILHVVGLIQLKLFLTGNMRWYRDAAKKKLEQLHLQRPINAILTICSPFSAHQAGKDFKQNHQEVRFCAYTVDPFATHDRIVPIGRKYNDLVKKERIVCESTDCLFLSDEAYASRQDLYGQVPNEMVLPYLIPDAIHGKKDYFRKNVINCIYAGSFYKDIRNPEFLLKVFDQINQSSVVLHLFSSGCDDIVQRYARKSKKIKTHGYVSQEELRNVYSSCDFLIGVGNATHEFLPSKTFEYLSICKPIVFFNPQGYTNAILKRYPYSLQISDDTMVEDAARQLEIFIENNKKSYVTMDYINSIYENNTPQYIKKILLKGLSNK